MVVHPRSAVASISRRGYEDEAQNGTRSRSLSRPSHRPPPAAQTPAGAQSFGPDQRGEIEKIVHDYLLSHPEVLQEAMAELDKRQNAEDAAKHLAAIKDNTAAIFSSPHQVNLGNPQGDVTMVEFFDYNCAFCKRAMSDRLDLLKNDPKLKIVLKEFPVLGEGSVQAAQVAVAVRMQDKTGKKYIDFHQNSWAVKAPPTRRHALAAAGCRLRHGAARQGLAERRGEADPGGQPQAR